MNIEIKVDGKVVKLSQETIDNIIKAHKTSKTIPVPDEINIYEWGGRLALGFGKKMFSQVSPPSRDCSRNAPGITARLSFVTQPS